MREMGLIKIFEFKPYKKLGYHNNVLTEHIHFSFREENLKKWCFLNMSKGFQGTLSLEKKHSFAID